MPEKKTLSDRGVVEVTFELPADVKADTVQLVGDFTDWEGKPMKRQADGSWRTTLELPPGRTYQFRYLLDGSRWENDWNADDYTRNAYGQDNSVIHTPRLDEAARPDPASQQRAGDAAAARPRGQQTAAAGAGAQKTPAKKSAAKKTAGTAPAAKSPAKKSAAKKTAAKKAVAKKTAAKKEPVRKNAAKKETAKQAPAGKAAAKKAPAKQGAKSSAAKGAEKPAGKR